MANPSLKAQIEAAKSALASDLAAPSLLVPTPKPATKPIMAYNDIVHHIYVDQESDVVWRFKEIISHEGPLAQNHPNYKGSRYNVNVRLENEEITSEHSKELEVLTSHQFMVEANEKKGTSHFRNGYF